MSALRKAGVWLGLVEDEDDLYDEPEPTSRGRDRDRVRDRHHHHHDDPPDDDDDLAPDEDDLPVSRSRGGSAESVVPRSRGPERGSRRRAGEGDGSVRSITRDSTVSYITKDNLALAPEVQPAPTVEPGRRYQITTLHPTTYREARTIGEHFREGTPVIMNLTEMDEPDARRLVDFGAGLAFGLRGTMERVTNRVFLLSPADVQVTPEDKAKIAEGGFFHHR
jgi:cell division inhibitor SepF